MKNSFLTVNKVETALDLLLCQQLLINVSLFSSTWAALINGEKITSVGQLVVDGESELSLISTIYWPYISLYKSYFNSIW